ncbi:MAG: hypothetical protein SO434_05725 [Eubacteriales bacterium]|nr:hypothetical protein [Eubacteriales bacterium]
MKKSTVIVSLLAIVTIVLASILVYGVATHPPIDKIVELDNIEKVQVTLSSCSPNDNIQFQLSSTDVQLFVAILQSSQVKACGNPHLDGGVYRINLIGAQKEQSISILGQYMIVDGKYYRIGDAAHTLLSSCLQDMLAQ